MAKAARSKAGLGWYLERIRSTPLLTAEEEKQLARRIREHSDVLARERMINANLRLVVNIAKSYSSHGMTLGDLVAEGNIGLMRAVEEFDPDAGVRFSTYAVWWIKQAIKRAMMNAGQPIHIPAYLVKLISKWRRASAGLASVLGRQPTTKEIARALGISSKKVAVIQEGLKAVNTPSQTGVDEDNAIAEMAADDDTSQPEHNLLRAGTSPMVRKLISCLEPRERRILEFRFGLDGHQGPPRTFKEIGKLVGLTRERVRQLEKQALAELKQCLEEEI